MTVCKECNTYAPPHCFRGRCATHENEVCIKCYDKLALEKMGKPRVSAVICTQCGEKLSNVEFENRMSAKVSSDYVIAKYFLGVERMKQQRKLEKEQQKSIEVAVAQDQELEDFVVVDRCDVMEFGYRDENGGQKVRDGQACVVM
ncbi:hypothetical protein CB0940_06591 [Cercospora beticola]|uniref:Uncharacterized protein n=1 Tax=Cercospora beticola TaxID=122368 RepID=A0A2G5HYV7_CERBT|nr:hypothetical protein CB0940_06591 [Cercospora beticola]PIA97442.1 hypothetical protein CB0940_06591 [Cercospora beticola]WPA99238.1 hypothetical protein RHO25_003854 [Cercospora beticola]